MSKITFFVDIDQTISTGHVGRDLAASVAYYQDLGIAVPETVTRWPDLFQLPEVLCRHEVIPGALAGVGQLARVGEIVYATVRAPEVASITRAWLRAQGFPSPDQVLVCPGVAQKLLAISNYAGTLVLVDDRWRKLLEVWPRLIDYDCVMATRLRERLTLVAFGAQAGDLPATPVVPVMRLSDWYSVTDLLMAVHEVLR